MSRKAKCWRWTTGSHGAKVTAFERVPGGALYIGVPRKGGGYNSLSLGHTDRDAAMRQAAELAMRRRAGEGQSGPLTVAATFAVYLKSCAGKQMARQQEDSKRSAELWVRWLGPDFRIERFGISEWDGFCRLRSSGELDSRGRVVADPEEREPVGPRSVAKDLKTLRAACRRATIERTTTGAFLLPIDPTRGLELPVEKNPKRPVCDAVRLDALMAVADQVMMGRGFGRAGHGPSYFRSILRLAHDTGRRISSILALNWSDWKPDLGKHGRILWRHESDKIGKDWLSPVTREVREELTRLQRERLALGGLIFPSANDPTKPVTLKIVYGWLWKAEKLAGLEHLPRGGFHALRRAWASSRKHLPLKDVASAGGWSDTATLLKCYITTDDETLEEVVSSPRRIQRLG